jgi:predicted O-linked N-acetylglucosamine transferase (SPINDLY family)
MAAPLQDEVREGCEHVLDLARRGREAQALQESRQLAGRFPGRPEPRLQLGVLLLQSRDRDGAERELRECLALAPSLASALTLLGDLLFDKRDMAGALDCFERLARQRPDDGRLWNNIALAQLALGRLDDAEAAARRARTLDPGSAVAWLNLGRALAARGHREGALGALAESLRLDPANADAHDLAGRMHAQGGGFTRAVKSFRSALAAGAGAMTASRLGDAAMRLGDAAAAIAAYRDAESRDRTQAAENASCALFAMHADERASPSDIFAAHRDWARRYVPIRPAVPHGNSRDPDRRLRVAYVSPRFHVSSAAFLLLPVLERHDTRELEFHCYAQQDAEDEVTARIRARAAGWRDTRAMDDEALAQAIRDDAIDIVVDLAGHTPGNRLPALARKPAPVALTWLDYFDTTGCEAFDAIVTDALHSPPGDLQPLCERRLRLAPLRFCYAAPPDAPEPVPPPSSRGAGVVFGAFHRFAKIGPSVVRAWADLLARAPGARLVIKNDALGDERDRAWHAERLAAAGLPMERVDLRGASPHLEMLAQYGDIDIALDAFPYNGGITTLEALWMGRPVVTLEGDTLIARQSAAILRSAGLGELVAGDAHEMAALAAALAADPGRIARLSAGLRDRLAASPVCDAPAFTRSLEAAYRSAWRAWCAGEPIGDPN